MRLMPFRFGNFGSRPVTSFMPIVLILVKVSHIKSIIIPKIIMDFYVEGNRQSYFPFTLIRHKEIV